MTKYDIGNLEEAKELGKEFMTRLQSDTEEEVGGVVQRGSLWIIPSENAVLIQRKGAETRFESVDYIKRTPDHSRYSCEVYSNGNLVGRFSVG
jgi:hypothetical protein